MRIAEIDTFEDVILESVKIESSVGSNLVRFGGSFGFLRFGRFEVRFFGPKLRFEVRL